MTPRRHREAVPVLVGVGDLADRITEDGLASANEPLVLLAEAAGLAADDAGVGAALLQAVDSLLVVNVAAWVYQDLPAMLAGRLGAAPSYRIHSDWGGNWATKLVDHAAARIAAGESTVALVCSGDVFRSVERSMRTGVALPWTPPSDNPVQAEDVIPPIAFRHGLRWPTQIYPLYENAFRSAQGIGFDENQDWSAAMWSRMSKIAARNPAAWHPTPHEPGQIATPGSDNRMIAYPYTKLMNAFLLVNQAAATILCDTESARRFGIPEDRWVYPLGGAGADDPMDVLERVGYARAPAMEASLDDALAITGRALDDVDLFELYSCFPCVPKMAETHLGLGRSTEMSVTGGLTFFGGAGNSYMLHAVAAMTRAIRGGDGAVGLLYGQGGLVTKHHALLVGGEPPAGGYPVGDDDARQRKIDGLPAPSLAADPQGPGLLETFTVEYARSGEPEKGIVIGRLRSGERFVANTPAGDRDALESLVRPDADLIGLDGKVETDANGITTFDIA
ncbi:MAG: acetyl-CoA acetyltransferase [Actinomycetota bacterium]